MHSLKNNVAVVTGSASGIGEDIAKTFAKAGATVVIADINIEKAEHVARSINEKGFHAVALEMDVSSEDSVNSGIEFVKKSLGRLDILVCNAGVQHIAPITELTFLQWRKVVSIHLDAAFLLTKAALNVMYAQHFGTILYIGSVHSKEASVLKAPYVSAKHGIGGLCKVVAKEGAAHGVRAHLICPGFVKTPLVEKQIPEQARTLGISEEKVIQEIMLKETVDKEFTTLEDVSQVALFLATFPSKALTGQSFIVSHGWCME